MCVAKTVELRESAAVVEARVLRDAKSVLAACFATRGFMQANRCISAGSIAVQH